MDKEYLIYEELKKNLIDIQKLDSNEFFAKSAKDKNALFYLVQPNNNFYKNELPKHELHSGFASVASSASFIANILGKDKDNYVNYDSLIFDGNKYEVIAYEKKLEGLKTRDKKPQLDAMIMSNDTLVYIESKLTEWLNNPKDLYQAYLSEEGYNDNESADFFIKAFTDFIIKDIDSNGRYKCINKKYDVLQMLIHCLGIYNTHKCTGKNVELWNIVGDKKGYKDYELEVKEANSFIEFSKQELIPFFNSKNINFKIKYISFSEFYKKVEYDDKEKKEYIRRYLMKPV